MEEDDHRRDHHHRDHHRDHHCDHHRDHHRDRQVTLGVDRINAPLRAALDVMRG
ncbi:MAG: hypothetical protein Q8K58_16790 [Acidimicrobiales bacterium]|nr:hypothetical protein [Acidimicrobiales bacterium]